MACQDRMLSVFSSCGRRLLPSIQLATPVSALHCSAHFVMVLTAGAMLSVWSVLTHTRQILQPVFVLLKRSLVLVAQVLGLHVLL